MPVVHRVCSVIDQPDRPLGPTLIGAIAADVGEHLAERSEAGLSLVDSNLGPWVGESAVSGLSGLRFITRFCHFFLAGFIPFNT